jgi:hypothetical protein
VQPGKPSDFDQGAGVTGLSRILAIVGILGAGMLALVFASWLWWAVGASNVQFPDYHVDTLVRYTPAAPGSGAFRAGASAVKITPSVPDTFVDVNGNGEWDDGIDRWTDRNGSRKFDVIWMAGFGRNRPAAGIHDNLWARTVVFGYDDCRVAICSVDLVGLFYQDVIDIRQRVARALAGSADSVSHVIVTSTHNHDGPDVIGLWGLNPAMSGVDQRYLEMVRRNVTRSIVAAARSAVSARVQFAEGSIGTSGTVHDSRKPIVIDDTLAVARFTSLSDGQTIATLVNYGRHPEALSDGNLLITSGSPHYVREGVEKGLPASNDGNGMRKGLGGLCVYVAGSAGDLTHGAQRLPQDTLCRRSGFDGAKAQGRIVAARVLDLLSSAVPAVDDPPMAFVARTIYIPLANEHFRAALKLGAINRGLVAGDMVRTEVDAIVLGLSTWTSVPGEIHPEIVVGGVESPAGGDFGVDPVETPPIKAMMSGRPRFIIGLGNDELGHIIPKSQWDTRAPFAYGRKETPYGEMNSLGPDTAPMIHQAVRDIWKRLKTRNPPIAASASG